MINILFKKIIGIFIVMVLFVGLYSFAEGATLKSICEGTPNPGNKGTRTPTENDNIGICKCPDGTKRMPNGTNTTPSLKGCVSCSAEGVCCGVKLNTKVPFIGNCIEFAKKCINNVCPTGYKCDEKSNKCRVIKTDPNQTVIDEEEAFPTLMGGLIRILVTIIMLGSFMAILAGGVMISAAGSDDQKAAKGKKLIINVAIAIALLGASGVILRLINPNFFG